MRLAPDGSKLFITGVCDGPSSHDYVTLAYDTSTATMLWASTYNGAGNGNDWASGLAVSPDGSTVFVTGYSPGTKGLDNHVTVAYA